MTVGAALATAVAAGAAPAASAPAPAARAQGKADAPATAGAGEHAVLSAPAAAPADGPAAAERYWTPGRRAGALRADLLVRAGGDERQPEPARPWHPGRLAYPTPASPSSGAAYTLGGLASRTVGKLFLTLDGIDYVCSASIVNSNNQDLLVTAGHCVHGGGPTGSFATNVAFAPAYENGTMPYGLWMARQLATTAGWANQLDFTTDVGFVVLAARGATHLQQVVGALGILFNLPRGIQQHVFGYPTLYPYDGRQLYYCAGVDSPDPNGGTALGLGCTMTAGVSGGPWLVGLSWFAAGHGFVNSVVSYNYQEDPSRLYGPYFGDTIMSVYQSSANL